MCHVVLNTDKNIEIKRTRLFHSELPLNSSFSSNTIKTYFTNDWGIDDEFVESLILFDEKKLETFDWKLLKETIHKIAQTGDIKYGRLTEELVKIAEEVMEVDGKIHPHEKDEINNLCHALGMPTKFE